MGCAQSKPVKCPTCNHKFIDSHDVLHHLEKEHQMQRISCPKCGLHGFKDTNHLIEHVISNHEAAKDRKDTLNCPKCKKQDFKDSSALMKHFEEDHIPTSTTLIPVKEAKIDALSPVESSDFKLVPINQDYRDKLKNKALPRVGDKVLAMWSTTPWQYFHAVVRKFIPSKLQFEIDWDDPDPTGRIVDYYNLAVDKPPNAKDISIGSVVLFPQGEYVGGPLGGTYGGVRWHQGRITHIHNDGGIQLFEGVHTKGNEDNKWITYKGYSYSFSGLRLEELRIGPNVFDILDDNNCTQDASDDDIDIYFSYAVSDSPKAIKNREILQAPQNYASVLDKICDPRDIADHLKATGLKLGIRKPSENEDLKKTAMMMKRAKVFIACISDEYVANDECRMEFQYAKTTLGTPVVPLVVGNGSFDWTMSVVGMLIAGELYIHFKDKTVENIKLNELLSTLKGHCEKISDLARDDELQVKGKADVFLSYNWTNSYLAKEAKQISDIVGQQFSDPRLVKQELEKAGFKVWIDIERLRSANAGAGMYEQLTNALKDAQVVIPCVSSEYANSANCRMEFQYALKSLQKPIIPLIVGEGDDWKTSVIGGLVDSSSNKSISLQSITNHQSLMEQLNPLFNQINEILMEKPPPSFQQKTNQQRAPRIGDHVVSHHMACTYYMATVVSFNPETMEYTVDWDDGDQSGRVQPYDQVAIDIVPDTEDVAVGSIVFFPQGSYIGTERNNTGGVMYHEGIVTSCRLQGSSKLLSGHHTKGQDDGKWINYGAYSHEFHDIALENIRMAPSAMDALVAANS